MVRRTAVVWGCLTRHLRLTELLRDLVVLIGLGSLAGFAILFTSRVVFDNITYEAALTFQSRASGTASRPGSLTVAAYENADVARGQAVTELRALQQSVNATVLVYQSETSTAAQRLFEGTLVKGALCPDGVVVDEATAAAFGLEVGGQGALVLPELGAATPVGVRICGIGVPWHPGGSLGSRGYVVAADSFMTQRFSGFPDALTGETTSYWMDTTPAGAVTKAAAVRSVLGDNPTVTTFVVVVVLAGLLLWLFGVVRTTQGVRKMLSLPWSVVTSMGARPGTLGLYLVVVLGVMSAVAGVAAAALARGFILAWTSLYVTTRQIGFVAVVLVLVTLVVVAVLGRRYSRA